MAIRSQIEWTEATWNPTTGCTKVSAGCKNCFNASLNRFILFPLVFLKTVRLENSLFSYLTFNTH
jgi:hypothetical protein